MNNGSQLLRAVLFDKLTQGKHLPISNYIKTNNRENNIDLSIQSNVQHGKTWVLALV